MGGLTKSEVRKQILQYRRLLAPESYAQRNESLREQLKFLIKKRGAQSIHLFLPIAKNKEPDFLPLLTWLWKEGITVLASRTNFKQETLTHHQVNPDTPLAVSDWGIPEPATDEQASLEDLDIILVPLLLYDRSGHRLGYGGGYYDRLLPQLPTKTIKAGISLAPGVDAFSLIDSHDIALDCVVTPFETLHCHED